MGKPTINQHLKNMSITLQMETLTFQAKNVTYTAAEKKRMEKKYATFFGKDEWKGSIFEEYEKFLAQQNISIPENSYDVYDLAALAYLYKRIKETNPIREASHVVIDEAQDFGMMAYCCLHYCLRDCTYTIMGDTSQNIHFGYGLNDWEELRKLILTGTYDAFGLLKKSYRNTVEISNFATDILRHGDFSIYPVEPIVRHGDDVKIEKCEDTEDLYIKTISQIKSWQSEGYETIAIVCRDEKETKEVWSKLSKYIDIKDGTSAEAEFANGIIALPVAYTKGLEFDAVLLFNPSEAAYPATDDYVKLLYVAATRALHQLVILYDQNLSRLIADPVPKDKHLTELSAPTLTKALEYEKPNYTEKELNEQRIAEGIRDMRERAYIGPKRIAVGAKKIKPADDSLDMKAFVKNSKLSTSKVRNTQRGHSDKKNTTRKPVIQKSKKEERKNLSPYEYLSMPDTGILRPKGHSKSDFSIKWIKKNKDNVELASAAGILRIMPITDEIIRVTFHKGQMSGIEKSYFDVLPEKANLFKVRENRELVEITTSKLILRVEKKSGAVSFYDTDGKVILSEKKAEPRYVDADFNYTFFEWERSEKFKSKGILNTDIKDITAKARYISHGGKNIRMPFVLSGKGYGIAVAAEDTVLFCNLTAYGNYIFCDHSRQSDYFFVYGKKLEENVGLWERINNGEDR